MLSYVWVAVQSPSMGHLTPAFTNSGISVGRVGIYKPLYQKPVSLLHVISWCLKGLMGLGTSCEADGKVWVSSSDFCCCFQPPSAVFSLPALSRHFYRGVRSWESHGLGNSVGGDFVAVVSCPISTMDTMEKQELFKMSFSQSQTS